MIGGEVFHRRASGPAALRPCRGPAGPPATHTFAENVPTSRYPERVRIALAAFAFLVLLGGCGDDGPGDAGTSDAPSSDTGVAGVATAALPDFGTCPDGWRTAPGEDVDFCDPWPESGRMDCADGQAHFPGEPGCAPIGTACPGGDLPEGLPADREVLYVLEGAAGGDGTAGAPYGTVAQGLTGVSSGGIVAIGAGSYDENLQMRRSATLWGACVERTRLTSTVDDLARPVLVIAAPDVEVRNLRVSDSLSPGISTVTAAATVRLEGIVVERTRAIGLFIDDLSTVSGQELLVREVQPAADMRFGRGMLVDDGAQVTFTRAVFEGNHDIAVNVVQMGTSATLEAVALLNTQPRALGNDFGYGLDIAYGGALTATRVVLEGNHTTGLFAAMGGTVTMHDSLIRGTRFRPSDGTRGRGFFVREDIQAQLTRVLLEDNQDLGIFASRGAVLGLEDVAISGVASRENDDGGGRGMSVQSGAQVHTERVLIERARDGGIHLALEDSHFEAIDLTVRHIDSIEATGRGGRGIHVQEQALLEGTRIHIYDTREVGLMAAGEATIDLSAVIARDILPQRCSEMGCGEADVTVGVSAAESASIQLHDFLVQSSAVCGVQIADTSSMDLSSGTVQSCLIGACVQVDGYDLDRLTNDVAYLDNETNLDSTRLPVPSPQLELSPED